MKRRVYDGEASTETPAMHSSLRVSPIDLEYCLIGHVNHLVDDDVPFPLDLEDPTGAKHSLRKGRGRSCVVHHPVERDIGRAHSGDNRHFQAVMDLDSRRELRRRYSLGYEHTCNGNNLHHRSRIGRCC